GAPLDLLFLREEALELGIGLADDGRQLLGPRFVSRRRGARLGLGGTARGSRLGLIGTAATPTGGDDPPGPDLARRLADGHRGFAADLVLRRRPVGKDVALV